MASSEVLGTRGPSILAGAQNLGVNNLGYNEVGGNMYGPTVNIYGSPQLPPLSSDSIYEVLRSWLPLIFVSDAQEPGQPRDPNPSARSAAAPNPTLQGRRTEDSSQSTETNPQASFVSPSGDYTATLMGESEPFASFRATMPQVYVYHMLRAGKGLACWKPEPSYSPPAVNPKGAVPGDVGMYTPEGGFKKIFNLWDDEHSLKIMARTLDQAEYKSPPNGLVVNREFQRGATVTRGAVAEVHESLAGESIERFEFKCQDQEGAVLISVSEAILEEVVDSAMFHDHICTFAELIYRHADSIRRIGNDTSLYIVTGCIKATDWGLAAFQEPMTHPDNVLKLVRRRNGEYLWTHRGTAEAKSGSSEPRNVKDQCLFLQGHKLDFSKAFRARLRSEQPQNRDGAPEGGANSGPAHDKGNDHQRGEGGRDEMAGGNPNCSNTGGAPPAAGDSFSTRVLDVGVSTTTFPEASRRLTCHPCDVITERLLELTGADFALSHDNDWCPLFEGLSEVDAKGVTQSALIPRPRRTYLHYGVAGLEPRVDQACHGFALPEVTELNRNTYIKPRPPQMEAHDYPGLRSLAGTFGMPAFAETERTKFILQAITTVIPGVTNIPDLELDILPAEDFTLIPEAVAPITGRQHYSPYAVGSSADIFRAVSRAEGTNGEMVVFKVFRDAWSLGTGTKEREEATWLFVKRLRRECAVWGMLKHRNISRLWGVVIHPELSSAGLVSSFMPHGDLGEFIKKKIPYDCITMAQGVACALEYLHAITPGPVVHGSVTPANILIDYDETTKKFFPLLTGFGRSRVMERHGYTTSVSNMHPLYHAPEIVADDDATEDTNKRLVPGSDVYSLGMLLYKLITGHDPFYKERFSFPIALSIAIAEEGLRMTKDKYPVPSQYEWCWPIMEACWEFKAEERLTSKEAYRRLRKGPGADGTSTPVPITFVAANEA